MSSNLAGSASFSSLSGSIPRNEGGLTRDYSVREAHYHTNYSFRGKLTTEFHLGRPNYGEAPSIDELERTPVLLLDEPLRVIPDPPTGQDGDYYAVGREKVTKMQLAGPVDFDRLREIRGHGVELYGHIFPQHTGHHHTSVLLSLDKTKPAEIVDNRDTFVGPTIAKTGTGFLLGHTAHILTAAHVVKDARGVTVARGLLRSIARIIDFSEQDDIAILSAEIGCDVELKLRLWERPQLGESIYVLGFPLRPVLPHSLNMTSGMVSAEVGPTRSGFQISAPVQKGNSGGPIFDRFGNLFGMVRSKLLPVGEAVPENVNFATGTHSIGIACKRADVRISECDPWQRTPVEPVVLGKVAHQVCVEIEAWR
ncbi:MAG TPA: trypsin-like peptidase domain-containing protein [Stellaceae bacterium]|nr:trypsin-like peptidase domain-containing protein [Stellaceae bacterium]